MYMPAAVLKPRKDYTKPKDIRQNHTLLDKYPKY